MTSLKGHLLIATPQLLDPNFARTVLLMVEHGEGGAAGVVLNRPTDATVADISKRILPEPVDWDKPIHLGGPVPGPMMVLHTVEDLGDLEVIPGIFSTIDAVKIQQILQRQPEPSLILANYAGWGPGQLENEIQEDSWFTLPASAGRVFWTESSDLWGTLIQEINASKLSQILGIDDVPPDPTWN